MTLELIPSGYLDEKICMLTCNKDAIKYANKMSLEQPSFQTDIYKIYFSEMPIIYVHMLDGVPAPSSRPLPPRFSLAALPPMPESSPERGV